MQEDELQPAPLSAKPRRAEHRGARQRRAVLDPEQDPALGEGPAQTLERPGELRVVPGRDLERALDPPEAALLVYEVPLRAFRAVDRADAEELGGSESDDVHYVASTASELPASRHRS